MPAINQFTAASYGFKSATAQLYNAGGTAYPGGFSSLKHTSAEGFVYGRSAPNTAMGDGYYDLYRFSIVVEGTGIEYGGNGAVSGTVTSISIVNEGTVLPDNQFVFRPRMTITGLSLDLSIHGDDLFHAFEDNHLPLQAYFDTLPWFHAGSAGVDEFKGGVFADVVQGNAGSDILQGGAGDDKLFGGADDDVLTGGSGADHLSGSSGIDTVQYAPGAAGIIVSLADPSLNTGDASGDTYESIEKVVGSYFGDRLLGDGDDDTLFGDGGNDTLTGEGGADELDGGYGTDFASYASAASRVTVSLANPAINTGDAAGDTFNSVECVIGSAFNDYVYGDNGANVIKAGAGDDFIKGYANADALTGGSGRDTFVFNTILNANTNVDSITDFNVTDDSIWLDDLIFSVLAPGSLAASLFKDNALAPRDPDDRIIYNSNTGSLFYDADGLGSAFSAVKFANLTNHALLTAADFVVI